MAVPGKLSDLALDTFGRYICGLYSNLCQATETGESLQAIASRVFTLLSVCLFKTTCGTDRDYRNTVVACKQLSDHVVRHVPLGLANSISNKILNFLSLWMYAKRPDSLNSVEENVLEQIVTKVIHPAVTRIAPEEDSDIFIYTKFKSSHLVRCLCKNAHSFQNLKILNLNGVCFDDKYYLFRIEFPKQLEEFSGQCTDQTLAYLINSCKYLKSLYISSIDYACGFQITDKSVDNILKITHLESLNIICANISDKGKFHLLKTFVSKSEIYCMLKNLAIAVDLRDVSYLKFFGKLRHVNLYIKHMIRGTQVPPNNLDFRNVIGLDLKITVRNMNLILHVIGSQLVHLRMDIDEHVRHCQADSEASTILEIGQYCKVLKHLSLRFLQWTDPNLKDSTTLQQPGFLTVLTLEAEIPIGEISDKCYKSQLTYLQFLIVQCVNVKRVVLPIHESYCNKYDLTRFAVQMNRLKHVEDICFNPFGRRSYMKQVATFFDYENDSEVVEMLILHCPNLKFVQGVPGLNKHHTHNTQRVKFSAR